MDNFDLRGWHVFSRAYQAFIFKKPCTHWQLQEAWNNIWLLLNCNFIPSSFVELKPSKHSCFVQKHLYILSLVFNITSLYCLYCFGLFLNLFPLFSLSSFVSRELMQQFLFHVLKWPLYIWEEFMWPERWLWRSLRWEKLQCQWMSQPSCQWLYARLPGLSSGIQGWSNIYLYIIYALLYYIKSILKYDNYKLYTVLLSLLQKYKCVSCDQICYMERARKIF